jgi:hypothetical protein
MTTNERQIAPDGAENLKQETGPPQTPSRTSRESGIDVAGQKQWLERKLQELTQRAGV